MSFSFSGGATEEIKLGGKLSIKQWVPKINQAANSAGLPDACMLAVVVQKESGGDPNAIGHDAHARSSDPFNPNSPPMYGLNWNYSHGIGLTQITIFPPHRYGGWRDPNTPSRRLVGKWLTVPDLINPDTSLQISAEYLTSLYKQHGNSIRTAFRAYNGSGPMAEAYADSAMALYNTCKAQNLTQ
ncbi:MAG TPA: transglycosylase SLT domain-containing protein, partial [Patescibacteria group bacterium]|nr:transglycosylase SLT domain-containing protein [Patescibacteria group bacterium]